MDDEVDYLSSLYRRCEVCHKEFQRRCSLYRHLRKTHKLDTTFYAGHSKFICSICQVALVSNKEYENHLETKHDIILLKENHNFLSEKVFLDWKSLIERLTVSEFTKNCGKRERNGIKSDYFHCHRSGSFYNKNNRKRKVKKMGSNKINAHCPARIKADYLNDGRVVVEFIQTHLGHTQDPARLKLPVEVRQAIIDKLKNNVPIQTIITEVKDATCHKYERVNFLKRRDIINIRHDLQLNNAKPSRNTPNTLSHKSPTKFDDIKGPIIIKLNDVTNKNIAPGTAQGSALNDKSSISCSSDRRDAQTQCVLMKSELIPNQNVDEMCYQNIDEPCAPFDSDSSELCTQHTDEPWDELDEPYDEPEELCDEPDEPCDEPDESCDEPDEPCVSSDLDRLQSQKNAEQNGFSQSNESMNQNIDEQLSLRQTSFDVTLNQNEEYITKEPKMLLSKSSKKMREKRANAVPKSKHLCQHCEKYYSSISCLNRHLKIVHKKTLDSLFPSEKFMCPTCQTHLKSRKDCEEHLLSSHDVKIERQMYEFSGKEDFLTWKNETEINSISKFVKNCGTRSQNGNKIDYFHCHRDGKFTSKSKQRRKLKHMGSNKMNGFCPAMMKATYSKEDKIVVEYIHTHFGHTADLCRLRLTNTERQLIVDKLKSNMSIDDILQEFKSNIHNISNTSRLYVLNRKDILNIQRELRQKAIRGFKSTFIKTENEDKPQTLNDAHMVEISDSDARKLAATTIENNSSVVLQIDVSAYEEIRNAELVTLAQVSKTGNDDSWEPIQVYYVVEDPAVV